MILIFKHSVIHIYILYIEREKERDFDFSSVPLDRQFILFDFDCGMWSILINVPHELEKKMCVCNYKV